MTKRHAADLTLLLVTDRALARDGDLVGAVTRALAGGVTAVMLREKDLSTEDLVALGRGVRAACHAADVPFIVNHDLRAALELRAHGVHLGHGSPSVAEARAAFGGRILVGCSTHDRSELQAAIDAGADYAAFGPVWDTPSKHGILEPRGTAGLADAVAFAGPERLPIVALGGVNAERAAEVRRTGAAGMACIGSILSAPDETAAAAAIVGAWRAAG